MAIAALAACGCVTRTIEIESDPPGAAVWVNHRYVGRTPVEGLEFAHYGEYQITLRREGCRAASCTEKISPPWFERFPVDFISDVLSPVRYTDARRFEYALEPVRLRPNDEILADAQSARKRLRELPAGANSETGKTGKTEKTGKTGKTVKTGKTGEAKEAGEATGPGETEDATKATQANEPGDAEPPPDLPEESPGPPRPQRRRGDP